MLLLPKLLALPKRLALPKLHAPSVTDPHSTTEVPQTRTTQEQVAAASAVAERMSVPTLDASLDALVAVLVAGPDVKSVSDLAGKTIAIDDRYSEQSISRVRTAMAAAGALEVQLSKGQTTAINRLVSKEVPAAVVALVSASAADNFPELARLRTFRIPLSADRARAASRDGFAGLREKVRRGRGNFYRRRSCESQNRKPNESRVAFRDRCKAYKVSMKRINAEPCTNFRKRPTGLCGTAGAGRGGPHAGLIGNRARGSVCHLSWFDI